NSPKRMRGSEMDDVIFAGTALRPSRNLAEALLELDNTNRSATAEYNGEDELIVSRRIERGGGSDYRINGKPVRQRDVHLLFADQATGSHSTSIVGQGQIDALIRAKPQDRRQILEEASGTTGLHARRHEAELKLKAAEQNLTRVDDVLKTLDVQLRSLKQQVRQASRYRNLAEHIRRTEAALLHLRWIEAEENAARTRDALQAAEQNVNDLLAVVTRGNTTRTGIAAELPGLRQTEAAAAAIVQKLTLKREQIEAEMRRVDGEIQAEEHRLSQARSDYEREQAHHSDGESAVTRLAAEQAQLAARAAEIASGLPEAHAALTSTTAEVEAMDAVLASLTETAASVEAKEQALRQEIEALAKRRAELTDRRAGIDEQRMALAAGIAARPDLSQARDVVEACEKNLAHRQTQAHDAEQARHEAERALQAQREKTQEAQAKHTKMKAEADAISAVLQQHSNAEQVINLITVTPGLENALAVALGEALTAALDPQAAQHWRTLPPLENAAPLPAGTVALSRHIQAPPALARSLSQIGLIDSHAEGEAASAALLPGQILVSREGWAWRWDGFTVTPEAKTATALRLQQRNRLAALQDEIADAESGMRNAEAALEEAAALFRNCQALDQETRLSVQMAFEALNGARNKLAAQEREAAAADARLSTLSDNLRHITADIAQLRLRADAVEEERAALPATEDLRAAIAVKRAGLADMRGTLTKQQGEHGRLLHEQQSCAERRQTIAEEQKAWQERMANAATQSRALAERIAALEDHLARLRARPDELKAAHSGMLSELGEAEARRREAADALIAAEQRLSVTEHQLKQDEAALGAAREERVRAEAAVQAAQDHFTTLRERMAEKINSTPEELRGIAGLDDGESWPSVFELEQTLGRYLRERDNMGPVNLRADVEADAVQANIDKLQSEKDDLAGAIAKLRQGIAQLNREARERLQAAFSQVNERFEVLFKRLFGGGRAHLELIDNEDPMNAGLEIFASPPGKKQQILSLLSGGERTLTALALLFAVFQTNPSPICVLDEAEAALDESNIDRFCALIKDIAKETGTRFLIVTHQRLTMAHMDRLYGVTMSEKGVSRLVSVDLEGAVALRDGELPEPVSATEESLAAVQAA
ncbi:MAG: chromosome segregation protein SMC, partial [Alphaproteobacteria bacterium]|nr:chromosome segregation protein SMC [Alphaproteobacteria bacterium]